MISGEELRKFLIYPNLNYFTQSVYKRTGYFGNVIFPLFYIENPMDKEMGEIIKNELGWQDSNTSEYTKHFDCIAEPFTNYVRNQIYGYERRICQYSNMIRRGEINRAKAVQMFESDNFSKVPPNSEKIMEYLDVTQEGLKTVLSVKPLTYEKHTSKMNRLFAVLKQAVDHVMN